MLRAEIEQLFEKNPAEYTQEHRDLFQRFKDALNSGEIRAAEPDSSANTGWRVNAWVKKGILLGFRMGATVDMSIDAARQPFFDKATYPVKNFTATSGVRIVPGGWRLYRQGRDVHASHVRECGSLRGRGHHGGFTRSCRELRANRQKVPYFCRFANRGRSRADRSPSGDNRR